MTTIKLHDVVPPRAAQFSAVLDDPRWKALVFGEATSEVIAELREWADKSEDAKAAWEVFRPVNEEVLEIFAANVTRKVRLHLAWKAISKQGITQQIIANINAGAMLIAHGAPKVFVANPRARQLIERYAESGQVEAVKHRERAFATRAIFETRSDRPWKIRHIDGTSILEVTVHAVDENQVSVPDSYWFVLLEETILRKKGQAELADLFTDFSLTARESEIAAYLVNTGLSFKEIAKRLGTKYDTVRTQINSIYKKCKVHARSELIAKVQKNEL